MAVDEKKVVKTIKSLDEVKAEEKAKKLKVTDELVERICDLYKDHYDDREEDSSIGGEDWLPGQEAGHKSLLKFQRELKTYGYDLSTSKIRKILITGGLYSTAASRTVAEAYEELGSISAVAAQLGITKSAVQLYLPYSKTAYKLENKTANAKRIERSRARRAKREALEAHHSE